MGGPYRRVRVALHLPCQIGDVYVAGDLVHLGPIHKLREIGGACLAQRQRIRQLRL